MADAPETHLRNLPRQARSAARVEHLLDVAEVVFEEVGYDAATTNLVAQRADVPVGSLYRWFPDKGALAEALADRYLERLVDVYDQLLRDIDPGERIGDFITRVMAELLAETQQHRALPALLVSAMVPGGRSSAGARLREGLEGHIRSLLEIRVPGLPEEARDRASEVCVTLSHLIIASAADADVDDALRATRTADYIDVLLAYLEAKFPSAGHPSWTDPNVAVKPLHPAPQRDARIEAARLRGTDVPRPDGAE